jgi:hypothetical protein
MKKNLIKEQNTTTKAAPAVVSMTPKSSGEMLQLARQHCNLDVNGQYSVRMMPITNEEALGRQRPDGGYNYVVVRNNQIWVVRLKGDNTPLDPNTPNGGILTSCNEKLSPYVAKPVTPTQQEVMKHYVEQNDQYQLERPNEGEINSGKFKVIDMFDIKQEDPKSTVDPKVFPNKGVAFIYKRQNIENKYINQYPEVETTLKAAGYTFTTPPVKSALFQKGKPILNVLPGEKYQTMFKTNPPTVWPTGEPSEVNIDKASLQKMAKEFKDKTPKRSDCRAAIKILFHDFNNNGDTILQDDSEVISIKDRVYMCKNRRDFISVLGGFEDELTTLFRTNSTKNPYGMRDYRPTSNVQAESTKNNLKKLIRESLLEIKENKKKSILGESKIVKVRLSIISENVVLKTKKQKDKFFDELLSEMAYLNSQGFDKQVINEGFWETLKGLFGHAPDGIMEYFKEYMAKWLVNNLTPMDSEGWFGNMIITGIGNLPIGDIPKLTDCNYLTKWISKTAAEGTVRKLTHEKGLDGPFYDILRNSIVDMLDETSLGSKIEEALGSFICPLLGGVKNKMEATTDKLKQKALATS